MAFFRYLKLIPEHLLAALFGIIFLPLRTLVYSAVVSLIILILDVAMIIAMPVAKLLSNTALSLAVRVPLFLIVFPLLLTAGIVTFTGLMVVVAVITFVEMIRSGFFGIKAGLIGGLTAMWEAYEEQPSAFERLFRSIDTALNGEPGVTKKFLASLEEKAPAEEVSSLNEELLTAQTLLSRFSSLPQSEQIQHQLQQLENTLYRYRELSRSLQKARDAFIANDLSAIDDELIYMHVTQPILFEKQYLQDEKWHTIPLSSYITEKESIFTWFCEHATHPCTRDLIKNPSYYKGMSTRYRWHELKANACYSQELVEAGEKIRELIPVLQEELDKIAPEKIARRNSQNNLNSEKKFSENRPRSSSLTRLSVFPPEGKIDFQELKSSLAHNFNSRPSS